MRKIVKTQKAADRDYSGAHVNQNFPYSTKKLTRGFSSKLVKTRRGFHAQNIHFLAARIWSKLSLNAKFFRSNSSVMIVVLRRTFIGSFENDFHKGPIFHTDFFGPGCI
jgi:hypothetical protein